MSKLIALTISAAFVGACSPVAEPQVQKFAECWGFQKVSGGKFETAFTAMIYPKSAVIGYDRKCPSRSLYMTFNDKDNALETNVFRAAERNGLEPTAFSGIAVISIDLIQKDDLTLRVTVDELKRANLLPRERTLELRDEMNRTH